jgi:hypothetical protein
MVTKELTITLVNSILRVLNRVGPTSVRRRWSRPRRHGQRGVVAHRPVLGVALDLDRRGPRGWNLKSCTGKDLYP